MKKVSNRCTGLTYLSWKFTYRESFFMKISEHVLLKIPHLERYETSINVYDSHIIDSKIYRIFGTLYKLFDLFLSEVVLVIGSR
jgi:hypothetical protein